MEERIQKIIAGRGLCSRRQAEKWILEGRVCCNGQKAVLGQTADDRLDLITVDGKKLPDQKEFIYLMLHKPKGYVTTLSDEKGRKNAAELVEDCGVRVYPVGRLDMNSEGLLLFTNDGSFANKLMHPSHEVEKTYRVWVSDYSENGFDNLKKSIVLDGYRIRPPKASVIGTDGDCMILEVTIHEGRNRQVRRMCAKAGMPVKRLIRIKEGNLELADLHYGCWRYLTDREIRDLNL